MDERKQGGEERRKRKILINKKITNKQNKYVYFVTNVKLGAHTVYLLAIYSFNSWEVDSTVTGSTLQTRTL